MIIPKMYDIELISNNYNPDANTSITITATATDYNGNPVIGESLIIKHNGTAVGNAVTTNGSGQANVVTTCGSGGTHQFTCKSASCIITVNPYPIGSIYISTNSTDPSTLFGGTWTQIEDKFLLAKGSSYTTLGATGGEASVTLTANQSGIRAHGHGMAHTHNHRHETGRRDVYAGNSSAAGAIGYSSSSSLSYNTSYDNTASSKSTTDNNTASNASEAHNNMPPYLVVSVWERTG